MPRHKDVDWNLPEGTPNSKGGNTHRWDSIHAAILMDLRDELKRLNSRIQCHEFIGIPRVLRAIQRNTAKKKKKAAR